MQQVKLQDIRIDGGHQIRKELNTGKVKEYAEQMDEGVIFPPVVIFFDGSDHWLASGYHRYFAEQKCGKETITANVMTGTSEDALWFAIGDNKHGLNMNTEDYRRAISIALDHPKSASQSNGQLAKHIGVSASTVAREKKKCNQTERKVTYINKHGKESTMRTSNIGKHSPKTEPEKPALKAVYDPNDEKMQELKDTVMALSDENITLKDQIAIGQWDASEIEKMDVEETIKNLRQQVYILEIDNEALRESRDMFQNRNAELIKKVNALKKKLHET